jgi:zinc finger protein 830
VVQAKATAAAKAAEIAVFQGNNTKKEQPAEPQQEKSSTLPSNFFDNQGNKRHSDGEDAEPSIILLAIIMLFLSL